MTKGLQQRRKIMSKTSEKTLRLVQMGVLTAIMIIFAFTPIGYLKVGAIEITFMTIPVAVGAMLLGPVCGAILGGIFGITSFIQCFGMSAFGVFMLGLNPVLTFLVCFIPRVLCGWCGGLIFKALRSIDKTKMISYAVSSLSVAVLNTVFFMGSIILLFWQNDTFIGQMNEWGMATDTIWAFLVAFVGLNGVVEAAVSFVAGAAIAKVLAKFVMPKLGRRTAENVQ